MEQAAIVYSKVPYSRPVLFKTPFFEKHLCFSAFNVRCEIFGLCLLNLFCFAENSARRRRAKAVATAECIAAYSPATRGSGCLAIAEDVANIVTHAVSLL